MVQHFLGVGITTNPFCGHIFLFKRTKTLTSKNSGMPRPNYLFLDLHEGNYGNLQPTSLIERNELAKG